MTQASMRIQATALLHLLRFAPAIVMDHLHQLGRVLSVGRSEVGLLRAVLALAATRLGTVRLIPHALKERRRIRSQRCISTHELARLLTR